MKYVLNELKAQRKVHQSNLKKARKEVISALKSIKTHNDIRRKERAKIREYDAVIERIEREVE